MGIGNYVDARMLGVLLNCLALDLVYRPQKYAALCDKVTLLGSGLRCRALGQGSNGQLVLLAEACWRRKSPVSVYLIEICS